MPVTIKDIDMETRLMLFAINFFGEGRHPEASSDNLGFFEPEYVRDCARRMIASPKVNDRTKHIAQELLLKKRR